MRLTYEKYSEMEEKSQRLVMLARRLELEDKLHISPYNKLLYWPGADISPDGFNMVNILFLLITMKETERSKRGHTRERERERERERARERFTQ